MENEQLAAELEQLERRLANGPRLEPSAALRQRVLGGVRAELYHDHILPRWRLAAAAAAIFVWISLSLAANHMINAALAPHQPRQSVSEVAKRIQQLAPDLSPDESLRQAMLFQSAAELGSRMTLEDRLCIGGVGEFDGAQRCGREGRMIRGETRPEPAGESPQSRGVLKMKESQYVC